MMTKKNFFETVAEMNDEILSTYFDESAETVRDFCAKQIVQLEKRSKSATPSKAQRENAEIRDKIVALILAENKSFTLADIVAELEKQEITATPNKVAALLRPAIDDGRIVRTKGGKKNPTSYHRNENQL